MTAVLFAIGVSLVIGAVEWYLSRPVPKADPTDDRPVAPVQGPAATVPAPSADVTRPAAPIVPPPEPPPEVKPDPPTPADSPDPDPPAVDLPEEGDDDSDDDEDPEQPEPSESSAAPYDSDRCWGCAKRCTYRGMRVPGCGTSDAIRRAAEVAYRSEHGYARDRDAADGDVGDWSDLAGTTSEFNPIAIARAVGERKRAAWFDLVERCSSFVASELSAGRDPWAVRPVAMDAAEECPF